MSTPLEGRGQISNPFLNNAKKNLKKGLHSQEMSYIMAFVDSKETKRGQQMEP